MEFMNEIGSLLQKYSGASATAPPPNVEQDFQRVATQAPPSSIASGLNDAFHSDDTPPFGQMVSKMFGQSTGQQKAGILNQILGAAGSSGLAGLALGGLSSMLQGRTSVTPEEAQQISPVDVQKMAEHAKNQDPSIVDRASEFYAQHPSLVQGLGAGALAMVMSRMSQNT